MAVAYTPGLRVTEYARVRRERRLPTRGRVLVGAGQRVEADDVIARAEMPGNLHTVRATQMLRIEPQELESCLIKRPGESLHAADVIAQTKGLWGLFKSELRSPIAGVFEGFSDVSGHIRIREKSSHIEVQAHIAGQVAEIIEDEGAVIEAGAALVQGIFGVGGERRGPLRVVAEAPDEALRVSDLEHCKGCVLVGGSGADGASIAAAAEAGAVGLVLGAVGDEALREYVGYDIGVAITGQEDVPMTLILTEGFGQLPMAQRTWDLLSSLSGRLTSVNGATQIRAGVIRPEVIVTRDDADSGDPEEDLEQTLAAGSRVRVIRSPHFGVLGTVSSLPVELTAIETESSVRIALVKLDAGDEVRVPRANLEIIQG